MLPEQPPRAVLEQYLWFRPPTCQPLGNRGGFSGARLWKVQDGPRVLCLKRWPEGMTAERLAKIHNLLRGARVAGVTFLPHPLGITTGPAVIEHAGLWDMCSWLPGEADFHRQPSDARLQAACQALAQVHGAWAPPVERRGRCPGLQRRIHVLESSQSLLRSGWQPGHPVHEMVSPWAERAWALLPGLIPAMLEELHSWQRFQALLQPCWCDPWHDHVLFTGDRVTGLVDYGSVKEDNVAVDLARLLGSLTGYDPGRWQVGIAAYRAIRPLSDREELMVTLLHRTGQAAAAANWLRWLYHDGRRFEDPQAVAARLRSIVEQLAACSLAGNRP
jgi:hypothetical protein